MTPRQFTASMFAVALTVEFLIMTAFEYWPRPFGAGAHGAWFDACALGAAVAVAFLGLRALAKGALSRLSLPDALDAFVVVLTAVAFELALHPLGQMLVPFVGHTAVVWFDAIAIASVVAAIVAWVSTIDRRVALLDVTGRDQYRGLSPAIAIGAVFSALCAVGSPLLSEFHSVQMNAAASAAPRILNMAGRQRSFSQQIGRLAVLPGEAARYEMQATLEEAQRQWDILRRLTGDYGARNGLSDRILGELPNNAALARAQVRYTVLAHTVLVSDGAARARAAEELQRAVDAFLPLMDAAVAAVQKLEDARATNADAGALSYVGALISMALAIALGWPLLRLVGSQTSRLNRALKRADRALMDLEAYRAGLDNHSIVAVTDRRGIITFANEKFSEISGYANSELIGQNHRMLNSAKHARAMFVDLWRTIAQGETWRGEICNRAKDGSLYWVDTTIVPLMGSEGRPERYVSIRNDITVRKNAELVAARRQEIETVVHDMQSDMLTTGSLSTAFNRALAALRSVLKLDAIALYEVGHTKDGGLWSVVLSSSSAESLEPAEIPRTVTLANLAEQPAIIRECAAKGILFSKLDAQRFGAAGVTGIAIYGGGEAIGLLAFAGEQYKSTLLAEELKPFVAGVGDLIHTQRQLDERRRSEEQALKLAHQDALTGLGNRRMLMEEFDRRIDHPDAHFGLLLIDLDRFKPINDTYGHLVGDQVLQVVAERLLRTVRGDCAVARLGGDEFAILTEPKYREKGMSGLEKLADRLIAVLTSPIGIGGNTLSVGASVGIAIYPKDALDAQGLLHRADAAMYRAKTRRGEAQFFDPSMDDGVRLSAELETELRKAVTAHAIVPHFQPVVSLETGEVVGHEVLARWEHPERGAISPMVFVPLAEKSGLIEAMFWSLLRSACKAHIAAGLTTILSVNLSPSQVKDPMLASRLLLALTEVGFPAGRLEIEVTESAMLGDIDRVRPLFLSLKNQGVRIALDDFGTGYSSLLMLRDLPIDKVKIDRSFVMDLDENTTSSSVIVDAVLGMAKALNIVVTAEGVETPEIAEALRVRGCQYGQGYLFGSPKAAPEATTETRKAKTAAA